LSLDLAFSKRRSLYVGLPMRPQQMNRVILGRDGGFDPVAVGVAQERRIIGCVIIVQAGRTLIAASGRR